MGIVFHDSTTSSLFLSFFASQSYHIIRCGHWHTGRWVVIELGNHLIVIHVSGHYCYYMLLTHLVIYDVLFPLRPVHIIYHMLHVVGVASGVINHPLDTIKLRIQTGYGDHSGDLSIHPSQYICISTNK